jgi:tetratricopeptide (TPR) repeat protein
MQFELKSLSPMAISVALEKAERYRLLNEPWQAESICQDVLRVDPSNQMALVTLVLAITDQFGTDVSPVRAREVLPLMHGDYERAYYAGIISERSARARIKEGLPGANFRAYEEFVEAMRWYEKAEALRPAGNDDSLLRWNTCARTLMHHHDLRPQPEESLEPVLDD